MLTSVGSSHEQMLRTPSLGLGGARDPTPPSPSLESLDKPQLVSLLKKTREQLECERKRTLGLQDELRQAKEHNVNVQKAVEQEEEYVTNRLLKRLEELKTRKADLASEVEKEERFLANTLQKKLEKLTLEKVDLENRLEAEQEYIVNRLQKQLDQLQAEKNKLYKEKIDLENQLEAEQEYILNKLQKQVDKLGSEKQSLMMEKTELQRTVNDLGACVERLNRDKVLLEQQMEMEEENIVNKLQRQIEGLLSNFKMLESRLESRGLSFKDLGMAPLELSTDWARCYTRSPSSSIDRQTSSHMHPVASSPTAPSFLSLSSSLGSRRERPLSAQSGTFNDVLRPRPSET